MKVSSNDHGHMIKMATMPIYGRNFKNLLHDISNLVYRIKQCLIVLKMIIRDYFTHIDPREKCQRWKL